MSDCLINTTRLATGWRLLCSEPGAFERPEDVDWEHARDGAQVPGTVASTLLGTYDPARLPDIDYDDYDWWYRCDFDAKPGQGHDELAFDGLATIAEAWLNGEPILATRNMFRPYRAEVTGRLQAHNNLVIVFRSLNSDLARKRPRPKWKTNLVRQQQLRWARTTLLGRIPGWTPPVAPVGPWHEIRLQQFPTVCVDQVDVVPGSDETGAFVTVRAGLRTMGHDVSAASLTISGRTYELELETDGDRRLIDARTGIGDAVHWSPRDPSLHRYSIDLEVGGRDITLDRGALGFRSIALDRSGGQLKFRLNGREIFCRGACWTTNDILSLDGDPKALRDCLTEFRNAGGNMIRIGGTMVYESDEFYDLCDELGIMVWQDFMFANMDYPSADSGFLDEATTEISVQLRRLGKHACIVAFCGNSEVEQQAAMFGMPQALWRNDLFYDVIPGLVDRLCPGIPCFPSSPSEGALPFHVATGPSHYFGVGAYRQPLQSVEKAGVKFTSECLAISNVPGDESLVEHFGSASPAVHQPAWKAGVPRDSAAGWDFEDIRDHYIRELYGVDPVELRYADKERYIAISQVVSGEVMTAAFDVWRSSDSGCGGALIWQLKDIVPGAGWGLIDSDGRPKPVLHALRRAWSDVNLGLRDRGMDGLEVVVRNDSGEPRQGTLNVQLLQHSKTVISEHNQQLEISANSEARYSLDEMLGRFFDVAYRYRFGPAKHDVVAATLQLEGREPPVTRCWFPGGHNLRLLDDAKLDIGCTHESDTVRISIETGTFLQHVKLQARNHTFADNYFHLAPGIPRTLVARRIEDNGRPFRGILSALNLSNPVSFS